MERQRNRERAAAAAVAKLFGVCREGANCRPPPAHHPAVSERLSSGAPVVAPPSVQVTREKYRAVRRSVVRFCLAPYQGGPVIDSNVVATLCRCVDE
eukprot:scaffold118735_cov29-Tisochrysis_lutea.AAC.6